MPASEETYRRQPTLHLVFAISSIAMLLSTVWMVLADHIRPWKQVQRQFQVVEREKLEAQEKQKLEEQKTKYQAKIDEIDGKIKAAEESSAQRSSDLKAIDRELDKLGGTVDRLDTQRRFQKADLDSKRSLYDGMIDRAEERQARMYLTTVVADAEKTLEELSIDLEKAKVAQKAKADEKEKLLGYVDNLIKDKEKLTRDADRVKRVIDQKASLHGGDDVYSKALAFFRGLPGVDLMPPTKIQQISLPELTINYNFKEVPRYDRCATCHQGIDRLGYDTDASGQPMAKVYHSHPFLTTGATTLDPRGKVVPAGLYLDGNGPHPINSFGCTICHGGQGSGTDFSYASHTPNDPEQEARWKTEFNWQEIHHWDYPMLPKRFIESSCIKCHHDVTDLPQAKKLQAGYQRIVKYGCTGCHTIGGEGSFGPDLTDERAVGPNLAHIAAKDAKEWTLKWITNPHAFRPDSRMPRFYGLVNNNGKDDWPKNFAEIHAITHYLYTKSTPPDDFQNPPAKTDPAKGKTLFLQKGCLACHQHQPYEKGKLQPSDVASANPAYKPDPAATYAPANFPASVREFAEADFGPNLSNIAAKFQSQPQGLKWLANWIQMPEKYHPKSLMPSLQLSFEDAADIASWILSVPGEWPVKVDVPAVETKEVKAAVDELVSLYVSKSGGFKKADGKTMAVALSEVDDVVANKLSTDEKLLYLGERTISRLGCFGCHNIPGFADAKPIGTALNGWGVKSPARLDYGHIAEYLTDQSPDEHGARDGTDHFYQEQVTHETRMGFLYEKLHRPRSYDYLKKSEKYKAWDDRLRMPQFAWANDPAAVEEVMTFVLGLTGERIAARYLPRGKYTPTQHALAQGAKVLNRFNCTGCHVVEMPKFTVPAGTKVADAFTSFATNLRSSYSARDNDYLAELYPDIKPPFDAKKNLDASEIEQTLGVTPDDGAQITIEGMPIGLFENELTVQLWRPVTIRGYTFNIGDNIALDQTKILKTPAVGGDFAWLYAGNQSEKTGEPFESFWNRLPPPLLREGDKVQTPWLTGFLKEPRMIRPAAQLRMPKFHYGKSLTAESPEPGELANYFAARDGAQFPYPAIPEQTPGYLADRSKAHPNYLAAGWGIMTDKASPCIQCHAIGQFKPSGGEKVVNGPDLRDVAPRFRPGYLEKWIANPRRLVPFTAMPQNIAPHAAVQVPVPKTFENQPIEMVRVIRDTLLNYVNAVELQLATGGAPKTAAAASGSTGPAAPAGAGSTKTSGLAP